MSKDINIHIKTPGAHQARQDIDTVAQSTRKVGDETQKMGDKARHGSNMFVDGLKKIAGPLGFAAVLAIVAKTAVKIAQFFDNIKTRCDEAVRNIEGVRAGFEGLYEAMGAFEEKNRQQVTKEAVGLLRETSASKETGLPVIEAYARQFQGQVKAGVISEEQYQQGLKGMLGYAERHGGSATPDLISLMAGWGMVTPEAQGAFRRQIATAAGMSGLTDAEVIGALGRGMPTIKAMGWSPEQAVQTIATLAAGETGRKKMSMPATTLQSLMAPQLANLEEYGISEEIGKDPQQLLSLLTVKQGQMEQKAFIQMLTGIYGTEGAAGVYKLISAPRSDIGAALGIAAGAAGAEAEQAEELTSRQTLLRMKAKTDAIALENELDISDNETYQYHLRRIGASERTKLRRQRPVGQWFNELLTVGEEAEKEDALYNRWRESLSAEKRQQILDEDIYKFNPPGVILHKKWLSMPPKERYEEVTGATVINDFSRNMNFYPVVGGREDRDMGPRAGSDLRH